MYNNKVSKTCEGHPISVEDYLRNEMSEANLPYRCFAQLHKQEHSNVMEMDRKDVIANTCIMQSPRRELKTQ